MLAPGDPDLPIQLIDARDIAVWTLDALDRGVTGLFNLVGPPGNATFGSWLRDCVDVTGSDAELVWADDAFLSAHGVEPWTELPLWMPMDSDEAYAWQASAARAEAEGLRCRPVRETVEDTWAWMQAGGTVPVRPGRPRHGMDRDREAALLEAWDRRADGPLATSRSSSSGSASAVVSGCAHAAKCPSSRRTTGQPRPRAARAGTSYAAGRLEVAARRVRPVAVRRERLGEVRLVPRSQRRDERPAYGGVRHLVREVRLAPLREPAAAAQVASPARRRTRRPRRASRPAASAPRGVGRPASRKT